MSVHDRTVGCRQTHAGGAGRVLRAAWTPQPQGPAPIPDFCTIREGQPQRLMETAHYFAVPDKFPDAPGHVLIISKQHLSAHGCAPKEQLAELAALADLMRAFLRETYGTESMLWENGGEGQSVGHAHLHIVPIAQSPIPPASMSTTEPLTSLTDLADVWMNQGPYTLCGWGSELRRVQRGSIACKWADAVMHSTFGMRQANGHWVSVCGPKDVADLQKRWNGWVNQKGDVPRPTRKFGHIPTWHKRGVSTPSAKPEGMTL